VTIENIWIPKDLAVPDKAEARTIIETGKLVVSGNVLSPGNYRIKITYYPGSSENLTVESLGLWLPAGFTYVDGSSNLEVSGTDYYSDPVVSPHAGGTAVVWTFSSYPFDGAGGLDPFPGVIPADWPMESEIDFQFTPGTSISLDTISWITTGGVGGIPYSWDADTRVFRITSIASGTTIEAYALRSELRQLTSAIAGDYKAIGNSLMARSDTGIRYRDILLAESSTAVSDIPIDAEVELAYLYWSAWFKEGLIEPTIWQDKCSNFDQWDDASRWTIYNSAEFRGRGSPSEPIAQRTLTMTDSLDLSLYAGKKVIVSWKQRETGDLEPSDNLYFAFSGDGGTTWCSDNVAFQNDIGSSFQEFTYTIPQAYLTDEFKMRFYVAFDSTDEYAYLDDIRIAQAILYDDCSSFTTNNWTAGSQWTIYNGTEFRGRGSGTATERTLALTNTLDLSSYYGRTVKVSWKQRETGDLESSDYLYFALSSNGGTTWSSDNVAFQNDIGDSFQEFTYTIPQAYLTDQFKMRFYLAFDNSNEYAYLDEILIAEYIFYDSTAIFKINGNQVYFDVNGNPAIGNQELTHDANQVIDNSDYGDPAGYSYACKKNVTDLILAFTEDDDGEAGEDGDESDDLYHPGNATYTVGSVDATLGDPDDEHREWAYAGWSLIIIYSSPNTVGHQLYLYDTLLYKDHDDTFLDFDRDGTEGGLISGFLVPDPVTGEVIAVRMTVFVGEGDVWYSGDYLRFEGTKLPDDDNNQGLGGTNQNNVWNGQSIGMSAEGVDVDTFYVRWDDNLLSAGDTSAQIDIWTDIDIWNLIYIILSFRSQTTTGDTVTYLIE
ncbi:MAG TPA: hypothetical protein VGA82_06170, partial [Dehalococcoidales bacterium]